MLRFFETDEARKSASLSESWSNTGRPVSQASVAQWREGLTERERLLIERIARREMARLGYTPVATEEALDAARIGAVERARYWTAEHVHALRVELRSFRKDKNVWRRWTRAWTLAGLRARLRFTTMLG